MTIILMDRENKDNSISYFDATAIHTTGVKERYFTIIDKDGNYIEYNLNDWNITAIN